MHNKRMRKDGLQKLVAIMQKLRGPKGCPWDKEQTTESLIPFIVEEAYEVISSIEAKSSDMLKEELGDLLFQIIFICQIAAEKGDFDIEDVISSISEKMIRRHPHVFAKTNARTSQDVLKQWAVIKKEEKTSTIKKGYLSDIPNHLPALLKAHKVTKKAAEVGFDWPNIKGVFKKVEEEIMEFKSAIKKGNIRRIEDEFGDLIFSLANLGRFIEINPEEALRKTIGRFISRFHYIEDNLIKKRKDLINASLEEMEYLWEEAKTKENNQT